MGPRLLSRPAAGALDGRDRAAAGPDARARAGDRSSGATGACRRRGAARARRGGSCARARRRTSCRCGAARTGGRSDGAAGAGTSTDCYVNINNGAFFVAYSIFSYTALFILICQAWANNNEDNEGSISVHQCMVLVLFV